MCATAVLNNYQARMGQTNLVAKFILCLIVPAYHTIQAELGPNNGMSTLRYWLVLSLIFLTELFLDQVSLSPGFSVLKLLFLVWCVLPIDNNGAMLIYENVLQPVFKVSFDLVNDVMRNKILEELLDTSQEMVKNIVNCLIKLSKPKPEPNIIERIIIYIRNLITSLFFEEVKKRRLFSDYVKKLSKCEMS